MSAEPKGPKFKHREEVWVGNDPRPWIIRGVEMMGENDYTYRARRGADEELHRTEEAFSTKAEFIAARLAELQALGWEPTVRAALPSEAMIVEVLLATRWAWDEFWDVDFHQPDMGMQKVLVLEPCRLTGAAAEKLVHKFANVLRNSGLCDGGDPHAKAETAT